MTISTIIVIITTSSCSQAECYLTKTPSLFKSREKTWTRPFFLSLSKHISRCPPALSSLWYDFSSPPSLGLGLGGHQRRYKIDLHDPACVLVPCWHRQHRHNLGCEYSYSSSTLCWQVTETKIIHTPTENDIYTKRLSHKKCATCEYIYICAFLGPVLILSTFTLNLCVFR